MIWVERNKKVHKSKHRKGDSIASAIISYLQEIDHAMSRKTPRIQQEVNWEPPSEVVMKINFDGSFERVGHRSCSGIMGRNSQGEVLNTRAVVTQNVGSPFTAETIACWWAIKTGIENGWSEVRIEGDALSIIKKCQSVTVNRSEIGALIRNIKLISQQIQKIDFNYVQREANRMAHDLDTKGLTEAEKTYMVEGE